jgi:hypothetical protein
LAIEAIINTQYLTIIDCLGSVGPQVITLNTGLHGQIVKICIINNSTSIITNINTDVVTVNNEYYYDTVAGWIRIN